MAHPDAEMRGVDGAHLADAFGQVVEFGCGGEVEAIGIAGAKEAVRSKRLDRAHGFNVVMMAGCVRGSAWAASSRSTEGVATG